MRIFKSRFFDKLAHGNHITDAKLCEAIRNAERGIIDADYGGGVIKQRIARLNEGKSGGYRSIILFRRNGLAFFVHVFAKNQQGNISIDEERDFKKLAKKLLSTSDMELKHLLKTGKYVEVMCYDQKKNL